MIQEVARRAGRIDELYGFSPFNSRKAVLEAALVSLEISAEVAAVL